MIASDPGRASSEVSLHNWQTAARLGWSFQHMAYIFPTALISRGPGHVAALPTDRSDFAQIPVPAGPEHATTTVGTVIRDTFTDGWLVLHDGALRAEEYPAGMPPDQLHLLMSVSKSLVGTVAGALVDRGVIAVDELVTSYVPQLGVSGYAEATVGHILDMRSGIEFSEDYLDPSAHVRLLEQSMGWAPRHDPALPTTMYDYLTTLRQKSPHGGPFEYRSGESDVLGWVCEAATGTRMGELMSSILWSRIGAEFDANIGIDSVGTGMFDGGISAALRDLARFGELFLRQGVSLTGEQIVSARWVQDTWDGGPDSRDAFASSPGDNRMPGGKYRNQMWTPYPHDDVLLCLGIHGQMIYINRRANVIAAKVSSWPTPQDAQKLFSTIAAFDAISAALSK